MVFLADVFVPCEVCGGTRYRREVLDVRIHGHSIHDVLQWTVDEAVTRFRHQPKFGAALRQLQQVGLGYLRPGQLNKPAASRLKIARAKLRREGQLQISTSDDRPTRRRPVLAVVLPLGDAAGTAASRAPGRRETGRLDRDRARGGRGGRAGRRAADRSPP
jgi:hypothetical protein